MNKFFKYIIILSCITSISMHGMNIRNLQKIACAKQIPQKTFCTINKKKYFNMSEEEVIKDLIRLGLIKSAQEFYISYDEMLEAKKASFQASVGEEGTEPCDDPDYIDLKNEKREVKKPCYTYGTAKCYFSEEEFKKKYEADWSKHPESEPYASDKLSDDPKERISKEGFKELGKELGRVWPDRNKSRGVY